MKKILFVAPALGLSGGISKWAEIILSFAKSQKDGYELHHFVSVCNNNMLPQSFYDKVKHVYISSRNYIRLCINFKLEIHNNRYDIVHITSSASLGLIRDLFLLLLAKRNGVKTVLHFHFGRISDIYRKKNWEWKLLNIVIDYTDAVIVLDRRSYDSLLSAGKNNIYCVENPIAVDFLDLVASLSVNIERNSNTVLFVGQMIRTKGIYDLLESCSRIKGINLFMCGPIEKVVIEKINDLVGTDVKWLHLCGALDREEIIVKLLQSSVVVLPSYTEGFPNIILEAMATKCPIISTPVGAIPEMLDFNSELPCGLSVPVGDTVKLKESILNILNNKSLSNDISTRAYYKLVSEYTVSNIWNKLTKVWNNLY